MAKATDHSLGLILATAELLCAQTSVEADEPTAELLCVQTLLEADGASAVAQCCSTD